MCGMAAAHAFEPFSSLAVSPLSESEQSLWGIVHPCQGMNRDRAQSSNNVGNGRPIRLTRLTHPSL
jgi:hypothetical protein